MVCIFLAEFYKRGNFLQNRRLSGMALPRQKSPYDR
jgi:hypothetical protein